MRKCTGSSLSSCLLVWLEMAIRTFTLAEPHRLLLNTTSTNQLTCLTQSGQSGVCLVFTSCTASNGHVWGMCPESSSRLWCCIHNPSANATKPRGTTTSAPSTKLKPIPQARISEFWQKNEEPLQDICGLIPSRRKRVVGGSEANPTEFPWVASFGEVRGSLSTHLCGAVLLHRKWVLTAAHCATDVAVGKMVVRLGVNDFRYNNWQNPTTEIRVVRSYIHKKFSELTFVNDIALLELAEDAQLSSRIIPICLAPFKNYTGSLGTIAGWGRLSYSESKDFAIIAFDSSVLSIVGPLTSVLHKVQVPFISAEECVERFSKSNHIQHLESVFICTGDQDGGRDACQGDSGGPIVQEVDGRWSVVSVISWGIGCGQKNVPGVGIFIPLYAAWIKSITQGVVDMPDLFYAKYGSADNVDVSKMTRLSTPDKVIHLL